MNLSPLAVQQFFDSNGRPLVGGQLFTYEAGTSTPIATYSDEAGTPNTNPVVLDYRGECRLWLEPGLTYKFILAPRGDTDPPTNPIWTADDITAAATLADITQQFIGQRLWPRTAAEISASVTPTNYAYPPGDVLRYGADPSGTNDSTLAIQDAISIGGDVYFPGGTYLANNLTQSHDFQKLSALGWVRIKKNASGPLFTSTGDDVELNGIGFSGDTTANGYTGHNIVMTGENPRLINCGSRDTPGRPVLATGNHVQIVGACDIYNTADSSGTGYDIEIGLSGTARLYHRISGIKTSQAAGGILFTDCGGQAVTSSQFGKLTIASGTGPSGANGGSYGENRILGDVTISLSNSDFAANLFGAITITLASGTSGHRFGASNGYDEACVIVDDSNQSTMIDTRVTTTVTYTPTWTAASVNPAIGDGSLTGRYYKIGKLVFFTIRMVAGASTTFGTGAWAFSLPAIPATFGAQVGGARVLDSGTGFRTGVSVTLSDGTARVQGTIDSDTANIDSARPIAWAASDELYLTGCYVTN